MGDQLSKATCFLKVGSTNIRAKKTLAYAWVMKDWADYVFDLVKKIVAVVATNGLVIRGKIFVCYEI